MHKKSLEKSYIYRYSKVQNISEGKIMVSPNKNRSASYPYLPLADALERLVSFKNALGINGSFNRETVITAIGYGSVSGASTRAVAALVHYGLLDREKDMYSLSQLGRQYLVPIQDSDEKAAIKEATLQPKLFRQIFTDYEGQVLPRQLANILAIKHGIQSKAAPLVVKVIEESFRFAGLIAENGTLTPTLTTTSDQPIADDVAAQAPPDAGAADFGEMKTVAETRSQSSIAGRQSVTHGGNGWTVTVVFEKTRDFDTDIRKEVRSLMNAAEDLSDKLYDLDSNGPAVEDKQV